MYKRQANSPGVNGYYLNRDATGIRWIEASPVDQDGILIQDEGTYVPVGSGTNSGVGQVEWTAPGLYSWTCPLGVTQVSVLCIGAGGGGANIGMSGGGSTWTGASGAGGALAFVNNVSVTAGTVYTVRVGAGGAGAFAPAILNISFILSLFFLTPFVTTAGHALSYGVLIGGVLQFLYLYRAVLNFYRPRIRFPEFNEKIKKFFKLFLPGVVGSGVCLLYTSPSPRD